MLSVRSLAAAAILGAAAPILFYDSSAHGLGIGLWLLICSAAILALHGRRPLGARRWLIAPVIVAALGLMHNDSRGLDEANLLLAASAIGLLALTSEIGKWPGFFAQLLSPFGSLIAPFYGLRDLIRRPKVGIQLPKGMAGPLLAALAAVPVMIAVGQLLSSADPAFARLFDIQVEFDFASVVGRTVLGGVMALSVAGVLALISSPTAPPKPGEPMRFGSRPQAAAAAFLSPIILIFGLFLGVQASSLFGGAGHVMQTAGLSFADYARRGFFQIAAAAAIVAPLAFAAQHVASSGGARPRSFQWLAGVLVSQLLLLLASAAWRMSAYVEAYGLSPLRFYVSASMALMAAIFALYLVFGLRWKLTQFSQATALACLAAVAAVNLIRPDALIAQTNLRHDGELDVQMILEAGADAQEVILSQADEQTRRAWLDAQAERAKQTWSSRSWSEMRLGSP